MCLAVVFHFIFSRRKKKTKDEQRNRKNISLLMQIWMWHKLICKWYSSVCMCRDPQIRDISKVKKIRFIINIQFYRKLPGSHIFNLSYILNPLSCILIIWTKFDYHQSPHLAYAICELNFSPENVFKNKYIPDYEDLSSNWFRIQIWT